MALFLKKGVNKKKGSYIYPEPTQTKTGNCAAYAGTACLYAFGLDHDPKLIPKVTDGTAAEKFQLQIQRMVERLTDLIYTKKNGVAGGYKKYLEETGLKDKFEVTEFTGNGEYTLPDGNKKSNWEFALDELKRCQDIIPFIKWDVKDKKKKVARHAVTLVGIDPATGEAIIANPWGKPSGGTNVPPQEAGGNTAAGKTNRAHTRYKFKKNGNKITIDFEGNTAEIYHFVKVCPVPHAAAKVSSVPAQTSMLPNGLKVQRHAYAVSNANFQAINSVAIKLPEVKATDIVQIQAPAGWSCSLWYKDREPNFDLSGPELEDPDPQSFAGVIWRTEQEAIYSGGELDGFCFDLKSPTTDFSSSILDSTLGDGTIFQQSAKLLERLAGLVENINTWTLKNETAILISENFEGTHAVHVDVSVPARFCEVGNAVDLLLKALGPTGDHYFPQPEDDIIIVPKKGSRKTKRSKK